MPKAGTARCVEPSPAAIGPRHRHTAPSPEADTPANLRQGERLGGSGIAHRPGGTLSSMRGDRMSSTIQSPMTSSVASDASSRDRAQRALTALDTAREHTLAIIEPLHAPDAGTQ